MKFQTWTNFMNKFIYPQLWILNILVLNVDIVFDEDLMVGDRSMWVYERNPIAKQEIRKRMNSIIDTKNMMPPANLSISFWPDFFIAFQSQNYLNKVFQNH